MSSDEEIEKEKVKQFGILEDLVASFQKGEIPISELAIHLQISQVAVLVSLNFQVLHANKALERIAIALENKGGIL